MLQSKTKKLFIAFILFSIILSSFSIIVEKVFFTDSIEELGMKNGINKIKERESILKNFLYDAEYSLYYMRESSYFNEYLNDKSKSKNLTNFLYSYSKTNPFFLQVRYIDKDGKEIVKIKREEEYFNPYITEKNELQDKSKRYYFNNSKSKELEKIWFSSIDLNKEYGKVEEPYKLTLRAVLPVSKDGKFDGILVINYFMESFLKRLSNTPLYDTILVDDKGHTISHYNMDKSFSYYHNDKFDIKNVFLNDYKNILSNELYKAKNLISKKIDIPIQDGLVIILQLKKEYIAEQKAKTIKRHITYSITILIGAMFLSLFIVKFFSNTLLDFEELSRLNHKLNTASQIAKIGFWEYDAKQDKAYWNDGAFSIYEAENYSGVMDKEFTLSFFLPEDRNTVINNYKISVIKNTPLFISKKIKTYKGNIKYIEIRSRHYYDKKGNYIKSIGSVLDVTEHYLQQQTIDETKDRLQLAIDSTKDGVWDFDILNDKVYFSTNWKTMLGYEDNEVENKFNEWQNKIHPDDSKEAMRKFNEHLENKSELYESIYRMKHKNGSWVWILSRGKAQFDKSNKATRMLGFHTDITKQKKDEEYLKQILEQIQKEKVKYEKLLESSPDAIIVMNKDGNVIDYNEETKRLLGYDDVDMVNLKIFDWDKSLTLDNIYDIFEKTKIDESLRFDTIHTKKDGTTYNASVSTTKIIIGDREYFYSTIRDITEQKILEKKIQEEKEKFESIYNYSKDGIAIVDLESNFLEFNDAYLEMTEYTREELLKKSCLGITVPEEQEESKEALKRGFEEGFITNYEKTCLTKTGKRIKINMSASLLPDKKTFLMVTKDMTYLKLLDEQSKLAAMGEMIGNIAHQWRQPLTVISTSASSIKFKIDFDDEPDREFITYSSDIIVDQVDYLSKTIDDFRNFIKGDTSIVNTSIKDVLNSTFTLVEATIKNNYIELIPDIDDDLTILGNKNELQQAIINIINNSKDAIKELIKDDEDKLILVSTKKLDDSTLELKIKDSGGGIKEEAIDRLFEPYFTTKDENTGTGIGLAMVDKILRERHHATIDVTNETYEYNEKEHTGACFTIKFTNKTSDKS